MTRFVVLLTLLAALGAAECARAADARHWVPTEVPTEVPVEAPAEPGEHEEGDALLQPVSRTLAADALQAHAAETRLDGADRGTPPPPPPERTSTNG